MGDLKGTAEEKKDERGRSGNARNRKSESNVREKWECKSGRNGEPSHILRLGVYGKKEGPPGRKRLLPPKRQEVSFGKGKRREGGEPLKRI